MTIVVEGTALYLRKYDKARHGTPTALAKRFADHGASWVAIAGPWHEERGGKIRTGLINDVGTCRRLAEAFTKWDVTPYVWGYPWQGTEELFADQMCACATGGILIDPELGSNPTRATKGAGKKRAIEHAALLVRLLAERFPQDVCGLSTYGDGVRMGAFPLRAFVDALDTHFPHRSFAGGQTYTDDGKINRSIADFERATHDSTLEIVPNFGVYKRVSVRGKSKAVPKTGPELYSHLGEFIDEGEPVDAVIGWAENFMNDELWKVFARFSDQMWRGACVL